MNPELLPTGISIRADWEIRKETAEGEVLYKETTKNLVVDAGRADILKLLFNLSGSTFLALGFGASSTAPVHTDSHLKYEYTATSTGNRYGLTNSLSQALTASDVNSADHFIDTNETPNIDYWTSLTVQSVIPPADPNNFTPIQEYGLFSSNVLPASPAGASGIMLNRLVANVPVTKDANTQVVVLITLRV